ncbi:MAG TPA: patatin family protein [Gammaproteobacteria bacterium]|nr:patatin family protein [Gammaproteobacteria bacterium]
MENDKTRLQAIMADQQPAPRGEALRSLVEAFKARLDFGSARKLLAKAQEQGAAGDWLVQQRALCTAKDEELPFDARAAEALALLDSIGLRDPDHAAAKTLELGGAVCQSRWERRGRVEDLYQALSFYRAAWARDPGEDRGCGGVKGAYLLDVLAARAAAAVARSGAQPADDPEVRDLRGQARAWREAMRETLAELHQDAADAYDLLAVQAEVAFGLEDYARAGDYLARARATKPPEWRVQATFKQLLSLGRLQGHVPPPEGSEPRTWAPPWQALHRFLPDAAGAALSGHRGKLGLSLSGGGFRASLFHLGVLARLAEVDALRAVEVLSTVSGGSIVGAHYYLEVQRLLQSKADHEITRADYITIVRRLITRFVNGVQRNLRTRTLADFGANLRMIYSREYSRSHRIGELYESELYACIGDDETPRTEPRTMNELLITPADHPVPDEPFKPRYSNWRRRARVPVLLLNATSLNTGHSWHFTARWMGEPPDLIGPEVDVNERYRRLWYQQAPKAEHKGYRLGYAVAASACVPGLFEPLSLEGLYPERTVRLVDGGVHDNQGVEGLLAEGCTLILCSDASGQMDDQNQPSNSVLGVPLRANSILMDRVRETEYQDLRARLDSQALQGVFFIHMKKELDTRPVDWIACDDPTVAAAATSGVTSYGVDKDLQRKLANLRTDLDSFSEVEASSLMLSGYLMTARQLEILDEQYQRSRQAGSWGGFDIHAPRQDWPFRKLEELLALAPDSDDPRRRDLGRQLEAGSALFFKVWKLVPALRRSAVGGGIVLAVAALAWVVRSWDVSLEWSMTVGGAALLLLAVAGGAVIPLLSWLQPRRAVKNYLGRVFAALLGYVLLGVHLTVFDPMFIKRGKLRKLLSLK